MWECRQRLKFAQFLVPTGDLYNKIAFPIERKLNDLRNLIIKVNIRTEPHVSSKIFKLHCNALLSFFL